MVKKIFKTECTFPDQRVNYFSSPPVRGSLDILWSCLGILLLCTWSIQRLNVPLQSKPKGFAQCTWRTLFRFYKKLKWMLITVAAPEYILGKAVVDLWSAMVQKKEMKKFADADDVEWTNTHSFFANMGGFAIHFDEDFISAEMKKVCRLQSPLSAIAPVLQTELVEDNVEQINQSADIRNTSAPVSVHDYGAKLHPPSPRSISNDSTDVSAASPDSIPMRTLSHSSPDAMAAVLANGALPTRRPLHLAPQQPTSLSRVPSNSSVLSSLPPSPMLTRRGTFANAAQRFDTGLHESDLQVRQIFNEFKAKKKQQGNAFIQHSSGKRMGQVPWKESATNNRLVDLVLKNGVKPEQMQNLSALAFCRNLGVLMGDTWILDAAQLRLARQHGIIKSLPQVSEDDLEDKNKGDFLINLVAIVQILWLFTQITTRWIRPLPVSQLEVVALAFAVCALITYTLQWNKPMDCRATVTIQAVRYPDEEQIIQIADAGPVNIIGLISCQNWMPNNSIHALQPGNWPRFVFAIGNTIGATIFGALHCIAWISPFPTQTERKCWRVASLVATIVPGAAIILHYVINLLLQHIASHARVADQPNDTADKLREKKKKQNRLFSIQHFCFVVGEMIFGISYLLARTFITVEVFRALCFLPPQAFIATWASNLPHIN